MGSELKLGEIEGVIISPQKVIHVPNGDVLHAMKKGELGYSGFGEAYFSTIKHAAIKAWKRHNKMTLNLIVPVGKIRFVMFDSRVNLSSSDKFQIIELSRQNYCRLTIPPKVWFGFQCISKEDSILLNISDVSHDPDEVDKKVLDEIDFDWS